MIYACHVTTKETVHCQALGFTNYLLLYAAAENKNNAHGRIALYLAGKGIVAKRIEVRKAIQQDKNRYAFPEQIH